MMNFLFSDLSYSSLTLLLSTSLYLLIVGIRIVKTKQVEGVLVLAISFFCLVTHYFLLMNLSITDPFSFVIVGLTLWRWLVLLLAPALIILFLFSGTVHFFKTRMHTGLVNLYFGLSLLCLLYMLGNNWSVEFKGLITLIFCFILFEVEVRSAHRSLEHQDRDSSNGYNRSNRDSQ